jgi:hypothetical protein
MPSITEIMEADFAAEEAENFNGNGRDRAASGGSPSDEAMPQLPDGIGLEYDELRKMLAVKHETSVSKDDPILMMVTICNVFLGELEKLHKRHNEAVTKIMTDQSAKYISGVKATTDALSQTLAENSVEAVREIFNAHATALNSNKINARWCAGIMAVAALVNVAAMAFKAWG